MPALWCEYRNEIGFIETLTCQFGCCEHDCCTKETAQTTYSRGSWTSVGLAIGGTVAFLILFVILLVIILHIKECYRQRQRKQGVALPQQLFEDGQHRPTIIIHMEPEVGQSQPPGGGHELPVAQGPPAYSKGTKDQASLERFQRLILESGMLGRGHSGYRRLENE